MISVSIRPYHDSDWEMVAHWWKRSGEIPPEPDMMPRGSSFIAEVDGEAALAVALYLTNSKALAWVENFIGNPDLKGPLRQHAARELSDHIATFAKRQGYKRLMCMSEKPILVSRYMDLGYAPTLTGLTTLVRSL